MEVLNLALHNTMLQRQLWLKGSKLLGLIRPIGGTSLFSLMALRVHVDLLKRFKFDERSLRGRQALFRSYKNSFPVLYKLVHDNYEEIVIQDCMPPLLVAHPTPLENDKPAPFSVKRRSESKPFCASCVVQSAAMSDWGSLSAAEWANLSAGELVNRWANLSAGEWDMRVGVHEIGDKVRHWKSGRSGTVTAVYEFYINIKFDLFNPDGWKYDNDGWNETRRRDCFIVAQERPIATVSNVDESAAKRARLQ